MECDCFGRFSFASQNHSRRWRQVGGPRRVSPTADNRQPTTDHRPLALPLEFCWVGKHASGVAMKFHFPIIALSLVAHLSGAEPPKVFAGLFEKDIPKKAAIGVVVPPPEIDKYIAKVEASARKDPKWFREFASGSKSGAPLPFDEKLGLTKAEYDDYLALWAKRDFKPLEEVMLLLRQSFGDTWSITSTGGASAISTLRYDAKTDTFRSPNGNLKRIDDVTADSSTVLGAWTGSEWKFEDDTGLGKIKENFAMGRLAGGTYGIVIYRAQELSSEGTRLLDKSLIIRFPLAKAGAVTAPPLANDAAKPATKPAVKVTPKSPAKASTKPIPKN